MPKINKIKYNCFFVAFLEGFAGLGIEIYALRVSAIYIGASTAITGIILAMVLVAIAIGYWLGGRISQTEQRHIDILQLAGLMLALSAICHTIACIVQLPLMDWLQQTIRNNLISGMIVGLLFGVGIAFGSACIPLITQYLTNSTGDQHSKGVGKFTGQMVATTTIGSVVGSTLTPIILIPNLG